jgi:hypothetical protein
VNGPIAMTRAELADMLDRVRSGDSLEGSIEYLVPDMHDPAGAEVMVRTTYRVGNLQGQGGMRIVGTIGGGR